MPSAPIVCHHIQGFSVIDLNSKTRFLDHITFDDLLICCLKHTLKSNTFWYACLFYFTSVTSVVKEQLSFGSGAFSSLSLVPIARVARLSFASLSCQCASPGCRIERHFHFCHKFSLPAFGRINWGRGLAREQSLLKISYARNRFRISFAR